MAVDSNRRTNFRAPIRLFLNEYREDRVSRLMCTNLSGTGIFLHRLPGNEPQGNEVELELELPQVEETVWLKGTVCHRQEETFFHGTGIKFSHIAERHRTLLEDLVRVERTHSLRRLLSTIRRNRDLPRETDQAANTDRLPI